MLVVEQADFTVGTLDLCDFEHRDDHGRLVSYLLRDVSEGRASRAGWL